MSTNSTGDLYRSEFYEIMNADHGSLSLKSGGGGAHHTLVGEIDTTGQGVRVSFDTDRSGNVSKESVHAGSYPPQRGEPTY
jgi:hypothetical protein